MPLALRLKDGRRRCWRSDQQEDRRPPTAYRGWDIAHPRTPVLSHSDTAAKTEVVLLITPHVVRNIVRPESPVEEFPSGTESAISLERMEINPTEATGGEKSAELAPVGSDTAAAANPAVPPAAPVLGNVKLALNVPPQVQSGKAFTVGVNLAAEGLQNAMLSLSYDPAKLKVVSVAEGDFLKKPDGKTQFPPGSGQDRAH